MSQGKDDYIGFIDKMLGDVGKKSAAKQLLLGSASGWCTGFIGMKIGKVTALAVGGGIILLQVANYNGYIKINWNKINKKIDKISDKVEEAVSGQKPTVMEKVEKFLDRKVDNAEDLIKNKAKILTRNSNSAVKEIQIFFISFIAGLAVGIASG